MEHLGVVDLKKAALAFRTVAFVLLFCTATVWGAAQQVTGAERRTFGVADMRRLTDLEQPAIAPDGRRVALLVIRQDYANAAYHSELVLIDTNTGRATTIRRGDRLGDPRWSADGSRLGFLAPGKNDAKMQLFVRNAQGAVGQITHAGGDVVDFAWRPDGRAIAFAAGDPLDETALRGHHELFEIGDNDYTLKAAPSPVHLWIESIQGGAAQRLTEGSWTIPPTDYGGIFSPQFVWRGNSAIVYTAVENAFSGNSERTTLWQLDVATRRRTKLTDRTRFELTPQIAPVSGDLAYWFPRDGDYTAQTLVHLRGADTDEALSSALDRNIGGSLWMPDGKSLLICANDNAVTRAWLLGRDKTLRDLPLGDLSINCEASSDGGFDSGIAASAARSGTIAFTAKDASHAVELFVLQSAQGPPRKLTHYNDFLAQYDLGPMREVTWTGPGGYHENGILTYPPHMIAGRKYPVVVQIHGGPEEANTLTFPPEFWPRVQILAGHGYIVFQPNYRGSDNLGDAYLRAWINDISAGPAADILAGVDVISAYPEVDATRLAVEGYSEGGLLTSWLIARDHRWRAAVSGAAPNDLIESYNLSQSNVQDAFYQGGRSPYLGDGAAKYVQQSPITFAAQVTTPTLIWCATGDPVVPIPMSYGFFRALRDRHVPVKFIAFPADSHGPSNPVNTADLTVAILEWLDRYMR